MKKIIKVLLWFRLRLFVRASMETMRILMPFLIVGSFAIVIATSFLTPTGFGAAILHISKEIGGLRPLQRLLIQLTAWTTGLLALFAAYKNAELTVKLQQRDPKFVGITSLITYILIVCLPIQMSPFNIPIDQSGLSAIGGPLSIQGLLLGLAVGYLVGQLFLFDNRHKKPVRNVEYQALLPVVACLFIATLVGVFLMWLGSIGVFEWIDTSIRSYSSQRDGLLLTVLGSVITGILNWIGLSGPFDYSGSTQSSVLASQNAIYALQHHSIWKIPYPFSQLSLYHSYATYGGVGATLALMIAIVIMTRNKKDLLTIRWGLFPALFNDNSILMLGLPIFFLGESKKNKNVQLTQVN